MYVVSVVGIITVITIICYAIEKINNNSNVSQLDLRINVNGIRGKSTATRLITAILWEAGYKAIGKTTGTAARMMYWDSGEETSIKRKIRGTNISEQIAVIRHAAKRGANALVCECMAVRPEYQRVYTSQIIQPDITVIVNVLEDHLEEMGPTTNQIADAFANTIPYNGIAVVPNCEFTNKFMRTARKRGSKCFVIDDSIISPSYLKQFNYRLFDHNCAVALTVARALGISDDIAMRGMLKAHPDPGALVYYDVGSGEKQFCVVNAFAANEPSSTLDIWADVQKEKGNLSDNPIIIMNCRPDRVDRTRQFINDFFPKLPNCTLITVGENTREVDIAYRKGVFPNVMQHLDFDGKTADEIVPKIKELLYGHIVLCVGNIHGIGGEPVLDAMLDVEKTNN